MLHVHVPTRPPMPAPSLIRAASVLTESSTETAFEDKLAAFCLPSPIVFADQDIFELEHQLFKQEREELDLELHIISNINQEIAHNPVFYPALVAEFGYDAVVLGTDITFRAFAAQHQGACELEQQEVQELADEYAEADNKLNPDDNPDLTLPSTPHPSASVTPAIHESSLQASTSMAAQFSQVFTGAFGTATSTTAPSGAHGMFGPTGVYTLVAGSQLPQHMPDLVELTQLVGEMMMGLKTVVDQVQDLTNIIQTTPTAGASATRIPKALKDGVVHPKAWTGKGGSTDARHFLAAYRNWASSQGEGLNDYDAVRNLFIVNEKQWISAVLNLMDEDACTWALPYLEELGRGKLPFKESWVDFEAAFTQ